METRSVSLGWYTSNNEAYFVMTLGKYYKTGKEMIVTKTTTSEVIIFDVEEFLKKSNLKYIGLVLE